MTLRKIAKMSIKSHISSELHGELFTFFTFYLNGSARCIQKQNWVPLVSILSCRAVLIFYILSDGISNVLGKKVKIIYKTLIRMESRGDKVDNRVLVSILNTFCLHRQSQNLSFYFASRLENTIVYNVTNIYLKVFGEKE